MDEQDATDRDYVKEQAGEDECDHWHYSKILVRPLRAVEVIIDCPQNVGQVEDKKDYEKLGLFTLKSPIIILELLLFVEKVHEDGDGS